MRTSKPCATIAYCSEKYLKSKLDALIKKGLISDYMFIKHFKEEDESKDHIHLWIKPNRLLDTMAIQDLFCERDPTKSDLIDFRSSSTDDWILYCEHNSAYLKYKKQSRHYHYTKTDFYFYDFETFEYNYNHAYRGSKWAEDMQKNHLIREARNDPKKKADLIYSGQLPLQNATALRSLNDLDRNGRYSHSPKIPKEIKKKLNDFINDGVIDDDIVKYISDYMDTKYFVDDLDSDDPGDTYKDPEADDFCYYTLFS